MAEKLQPTQPEDASRSASRRLRGAFSSAWEGLASAVPDRKLYWLAGLAATVAITTTLVVWLGFESIPAGSTNQTSAFYVLSTQAQVLGAILAVLLTLSLVAAQLGTRYSHRAFDQVIGSWLWPYIAAYLVGITLPLMLLNGGFFVWSLRISTVIGVLCLVLLAPYFVVLKRRLSLKSIVARLADQASPKNYQYSADANEALNTLDNIALGAFAAHDFDSFALTTFALGGVAGIRLTEPNVELRRVATQVVINRFLSIGTRVMRDPFAPRDAIEQLEILGQRAATLDAQISMGCIDALNELATTATEEPRTKLFGDCVRAIATIGLIDRAEAVDDSVMRSALDALQRLGIAVLSVTPANVPEVLFEMARLGQKAARDHNQNLVHQTLGDADSIGRATIESDLPNSHRALAFLAGSIAAATIEADLHPESHAAVTVLWQWAAEAKAKWNSWPVDFGFRQNLLRVRDLPEGQALINITYEQVIAVYERSGDTTRPAAMRTIKSQVGDWRPRQ